jgi:hypothetical protein
VNPIFWMAGVKPSRKASPSELFGHRAAMVLFVSVIFCHTGGTACVSPLTPVKKQ